MGDFDPLADYRATKKSSFFTRRRPKRARHPPSHHPKGAQGRRGKRVKEKDLSPPAARLPEASLALPSVGASGPSVSARQDPRDDDGTYPEPAALYLRFPQSIHRTYKTEGTLDSVLLFLIRDGWLLFDSDGGYDARETLRQVDAEYALLFDEIPRLQAIDFSPLKNPRPDYASQQSIPQDRIDMFGAAWVHYGDVGLVARYIGGEILGEWRDKDAILAAVDPYVSPEDRDHIERILNLQTPAEFSWEEPAQNKMDFLKRGNSPSFNAHPEVVDKALNKEERNHHLMPFPGFVCRFASSARHVSQALLMKAGKKARLIWDGTVKASAHEIAMNEATSTAKEAQITFGYVYMAFCIWLWNLRISYPDEEIYLAFIDISSCFRWPRIAPDLVGAFGFVVGSIYFAANAMVFGSVVSASTWEPFRRAIAGIATACYSRPGLVAKHRHLLDVIKWDTKPPPGMNRARATACSFNPGVFDASGRRRATPHFIYVDDDLIADIRTGMLLALAAAFEAIFLVLGFPVLAARQCAVALDKLRELFVSHKAVLLGLEFDTRAMTVGIPDDYRQEVCSLIRRHWHEGRRSFKVSEIETLVGKLGRIAQAYRPLYHLMGSLYKSIAHCLRANERYMITVSFQFRAMIKRARQQISSDTPEYDSREIRFAARQASRRTHKCRRTYFINKSLREELAFILKLLESSVQLSTHIGHIVPRDWSFVAAGDSCPEGGGGWSTDLSFWWHLGYAHVFSQLIVERASKAYHGKKNYISINVLETIVVIINYAATIYACYVDGIDLSTFPVLLNFCDNTSACSWINKKCRDSLIGRRLGRLFAGMLMSSDIGIQAEWLSTHENVIADEISRIKKLRGTFDYSQLLLAFPQLQKCRRFHPSATLLSMISSALEGKDLPDPMILGRLEPQMLGSFSS